MTDETVPKKIRKPNANSKAAQIRKLFAKGKLTPKQIAEKLDAPLPYVYVVRSKMKAEAGGLPAVAETKIPVSGGIQDIREVPQIAVNPMGFEWHVGLVPVRSGVEQPTFFQRMKNTIRSWFA
jgi:hypothetical protein